MSTRDDARAETQRALNPTGQTLEAARAHALLNPPAWQAAENGKSHPVQITVEEFGEELLADLRRWMPREPRTRSSWWLYVQQFAEKRFNEAYETDFPTTPKNGTDRSYEDRLRRRGYLK